MIFFSIGLPSRFAEWCDQLVCRLVERALGPVRIAGASTVADVGLALIASPEPHVMIAARYPTAALVEAFANSGRGFLIALDDPRAALQNMVLQHGMEWNAAIRATANSCAAILAYAAMPQATALQSVRDGCDPAASAARIARCFGLALNDADLIACAALASSPAIDKTAGGTEAWWDGIDSAHREVAAGALAAYAPRFADRESGELVWRRELFLLGDDPQQSASGIVQIEGGVRNLLFGPYIALPIGNWSCTVSFAVSREAAGLSFGFEVTAGARCDRLAYTIIVPDDRGFCRASFAFTIDMSTEQPISTRLVNLEPASGGRLVFGDMALTEQTGARAPMLMELSAALGL